MLFFFFFFPFFLSWVCFFSIHICVYVKGAFWVHVSNCDVLSGPVNSLYGCGDWITDCSSWRCPWVGIILPVLLSGTLLLSIMISLCFVPYVTNYLWVLMLCGSDAINRLINLNETTIASGDDEGCIKVWDTRQRSCCNSFDAHHDYVSDMTFSSDAFKLLSTR